MEVVVITVVEYERWPNKRREHVYQLLELLAAVARFATGFWVERRASQTFAVL